MARWTTTPGELERYIGAEGVRLMRRERELCLWCSFIRCVDNVKSEQLTKGEKITQDGKSVRSLIR